ncbi:MAG TPA: hypothetical protein VLK65_22860 [Vicinamibacteria bacterium]|nr:hypothetical protein [Vicinamibacteria bacterium]
MTRMTDEDLSGLIKSAPRAEASAGFTTTVMAKLDRSRARRTRRRALLAFGAALALGSGVLLTNRNDQTKTAERVEQLRREYRELESELAKLRRLATELEPVLELGGTEQVDFVLDLRQVGEEGTAAKAEPVSHRSRPKTFPKGAQQR